jgi:two-component system response regulator NreC
VGRRSLGSDQEPVLSLIRVVLAEDHTLVREGLKTLLASQPSIEIVAEAGDGIEAVNLVKKHKPAILLLDLRLPRLHGLEVLREIRDEQETKVIVISMYADEPYVVESLKNGVSGYLLKDCAFSDVIEAIQTVAGGGQYLCESLRRKALTVTLRRLAPGSGAPRLTKREMLVLELVASGKTSSDVALRLGISRRTAEAHRANLMKKLGLKTQTDLVLYAIRNSIISA